jgi:predicted nucleotidyltransferase component of viral defense system
MLNREKHQLIMGNILRDIYKDVSISSLIGLKGGTCAYFFYSLPRFSVDLDFDLLSTDETKKELILEKINNILKDYGQIKDSSIKHYTIFSILSYGKTDHNIKVEINTRSPIVNIREYYEIKEYLGIPMMVGKQDYLFASKLVALTSRKQTVMRDIYDVWYFSKNNWDINADVVKARTNKSIKEHLADCVATVEKAKDNEILQGLGELVSEKQKDWIRNNLKSEAIFMLKNYISVIK